MWGFLRRMLPPTRRVPERDTSLLESLERINHNLNLVVHHLMSGPHEVAKHVERYMCCWSKPESSIPHLFAGEIICRITDYEGKHEYYRGDIYKFDFGHCVRRLRKALPKDEIEKMIEDKQFLAFETYHDMPVRIIGV